MNSLPRLACRAYCLDFSHVRGDGENRRILEYEELCPWRLFRPNTGGGDRTHTGVPPEDFKSSASAINLALDWGWDDA